MPNSPPLRNCFACKAEFSPSNRGRRCRACVATNSWGTPPACRCGCGTPVKYSKTKNDWNTYLHGHSAVKAGGPFRPKVCRACEQAFPPNSGSQLRCRPCIKARNFGAAPQCACGCGGLSKWDVNARMWRKFLAGHQNKTPKYREWARKLLKKRWATAAANFKKRGQNFGRRSLRDARPQAKESAEDLGDARKMPS